MVENRGKYSLTLGLTGLLFIIAACFLLIYLVNHQDILLPSVNILISLSLTISGIYLVIANLGNAVLQFVKRRPGLYFRNLLSATEINYKFNQNKKVLFALTIVSTMIILFVCVTAAMYIQADNITELMQPNDLEYVELSNINNLSTDDVNEIINGGNASFQNRDSIGFLSIFIVNNNDSLAVLGSLPFVSQNAYNRALQKDINLKRGEAISIIVPGNQILTEYLPQTGILELQTQSGIFSVTTDHVPRMPWISGLALYPSGSGVVVNDEDYVYLKNNLSPQQIGFYHSFNFENWKDTKGIVDRFQAVLLTQNQNVGTAEAILFSVASRIRFYEEYKRGYSFGFFIFSLVGILFLIASVIVIYFKQFSELARDRARYNQLNRIGITDKEIIQAGLPEIRMIFFIPPVLAVVPGVALIWFSVSQLGGGNLLAQLMLTSIAIVGGYLLVQGILYWVIRRTYFAQLLQGF
jgi:putative ABC transport system permease protein